MMEDMLRQVTSPVLVGRQAELGLLEQALTSAGEGRPTLVMVAGEAGVGKTRLLDELARQGRDRGFMMLAGTCIDMGEGVLPLGPIAEALRDLRQTVGDDATRGLLGDALSTLAPLLPGLAPDPPAAPPLRAAVLEHLRMLVERLSDRGPVGIIIEDLHWSDPSSRDALSYIARGLRSGPVLMAWSYRADELHRRHPLVPFLAETERSTRPVRIDLGPLCESEVGQLMAEVRREHGGEEEVARLFARSGGNPFFVEELLYAGDDDRLPAGLQAVVAARLAALPGDAQEVLRAAAVIGATDIDEETLEALLDLGPVEIRDALRQLVDTHVLRASGDGYAFRHALLQEAAYAELLPGERIARHERVARALDQGLAPGSATRRALHWYEARDVPRALGASVEAGLEALALGAPAEAVMNLERALELWDRVPDADRRSPLTRLELLDQAARANSATGNSARALALLRDALKSVDEALDPVTAGLLRRRTGFTLWECGSDAALAELRRSVELVPTTPPSAARAQVLAGLAQILMLVHHDDALDAAGEAVEVAIAVGERRIEGDARCTRGTELSNRGHFKEGLEELRVARSLAEEVGSTDDLMRVLTNTTHALGLQCAWDDLVALGREGAQLADRTGLGCGGGALIAGNLRDGLYAQGRWDEMRSCSEDIARRVRGTTWEHMACDILWVETGQFDRARDILERTAPPETGSANPSLPSVSRETVSAALSLWEGDAATAHQTAIVALRHLHQGSTRDVCVDDGALMWRGFWAAADLAADGHGLSALEELRHAVGVQPWDGHAFGLPVYRGYAALSAAEAARAEGHDPGPWRAALSAVESLHLSYEVAYTRVRLAQALLTSGGDRDEVADLLRAAHAETIRMGANPLRLLVEDTARRARIRLVEAGSVAHDDDGLFGLTPREREVLHLIAEGFTNGQIAERLVISRKTASVHVSNILAKLNVHTRGEAAARVHRERLAATG
jgi:DNA-binding CsgD family transcriptional regulator/tetratricopeptide (TPR) repeat protein